MRYIRNCLTAPVLLLQIGENESRQELAEAEVSFTNRNRVVFNVDIYHLADMSGKYVCEITSRDGSTAAATIDVPSE